MTPTPASTAFAATFPATVATTTARNRLDRVNAKIDARIRHLGGVAALALGLSTAALGVSAVVPSSLRALHDSYQALSVGTPTTLAVELMGNPKTRSDSTLLGIGYSEMTWVDIAKIRYSGKFVADRLVHKSAASVE